MTITNAEIRQATLELAAKFENPYAGVLPCTQTFIAEQRDVLDSAEGEAARRKDAAEPETHKAWREILKGHQNIRYQIGRIRQALFDTGANLSPRGHTYIVDLYFSGYRWHDPRPDETLIDAQMALLDCMMDMPHRWRRLRYEEENGDPRQGAAAISHTTGQDRGQS